MFCRQCGTQNPDHAQICMSCGAQLVNPYQSTSASAAQIPSGEKPQSYLPHAIFATLCCCLPLGIVAIVYASRVDTKWAVGDYAGAYEASKQAKTWFLVALLLGLIPQALVIVANIAGIAAGVAQP